MLARDVVPGDTFIVSFESLYKCFNHTHDSIAKLKDKGYKLAYWMEIGYEMETVEIISKTLNGDWNLGPKIDPELIKDFPYKVDVAVINHPQDMVADIKKAISE